MIFLEDMKVKIITEIPHCKHSDGNNENISEMYTIKMMIRRTMVAKMWMTIMLMRIMIIIRVIMC